MSEEEIDRNSKSYIFTPCSDCTKSNKQNQESVKNSSRKDDQTDLDGTQTDVSTRRSKRKGHIETQQRTIQKFMFLSTGEIAERQPVQRSLYNRKEFHKYNMDKYHQCSKDSEKIIFQEDPSMSKIHGYFIISIEWMSEWRQFANNVGPEPGPVDNTALIKKIKRNRIKFNNPDSDGELGLADKQDYYIISVGFFKFFYDTYGCDTIVILKYTTLTEEVEINHDPLSSSNAFKKNKMRNRNQSKYIKGREFSAIYEFIDEVD